MGNGETGQTLKVREQAKDWRLWLRNGLCLLAGAVLAAGALAGTFQPLALGMLCAMEPGLGTVLLALGGSGGYLWFWGVRGIEGVVWMGLGLVGTVLCGEKDMTRRQEFLAPAVAALIVSATGVGFQLWLSDRTPIRIYLMRVAVSAAAAAVFFRFRQHRDGWSRWAVQAIAVLALAQISPTRYLGLGYLASGFISAVGSFPAAVLSGLSLDLAGITAVRMTGAMCIGWFLRKLPGESLWWSCLCPGVGYLLMAVLGGSWDIRPLPALILGGAIGGRHPDAAKRARIGFRPGEAEVLKIRLERMALAMRQMEQALSLVQDPEIDTEALLSRAKREACDFCPERRGCRARMTMGVLRPEILSQPGLGEQDLPRGCRKPARLLAGLYRSQEQLRRIRGERVRLGTFRSATREQYAFLSDFLRDMAGEVGEIRRIRPQRFTPEVAVSARSSKAVSGDSCLEFPGPGNDYYVLLCDGMGTGEAARQESREAAALLQQMLCAGIAPENALRSLNSMAILRNLSGCTTVALLQLRLDTGRGILYQWGSACSWLLRNGQLRRLGELMPPPGVSQQDRETAEPVGLARGETLILRSDGVEDDVLLRLPREELSAGELAAWVLEQSARSRDDATVAVVRLTGSRSAAAGRCGCFS